MKHPTLARVFSIVLCVFAVLMLLNAAYDFSGAWKQRKDDIRAFDLLASRVAEYEELTEKLDDEGPSKRSQDELDKLEKQYSRDKATHQTALAAYTATKGGLKQGQEAMAQANEMMSAANMARMAEQRIQSAVADLSEQFYMLQDEALNAYAGVDMSLQQGDFEAAWAQIEASFYELEDYSAYLTDKTASTDLSGMLSQVNTLAAGLDAMNAGKEQLEKMELQVIRDSISLTLAKADLEKQESEIFSMQSRVNEIKADERRLVSLKVSLTANEKIKEDFKRSGNVINSAKNEMARFEKEYRQLFLLKICICVLLILCAVMAFIEMPAAFEKKKSRAILIVPLVLFIVFASGVNAINFLIERRLQYLAFFAMIFCLIQLLIVLPRDELLAED